MLRAPFKDVRKARKLRTQMSLPEVLLWEQLRQRPDGLKFRRQNPQIGYKLDFCCLSHRVAVEVDGEVHDRGDQPAKDDRRDQRLDRRGFATFRVPAKLILRDLDSAITGIVAFCRERGPLHHRPKGPGGPPPRAGEDLIGQNPSQTPPRNGEGDRSAKPSGGGGPRPPNRTQA